MSENQNEKPMADQINDALMPQQREEMEPPQRANNEPNCNHPHTPQQQALHDREVATNNVPLPSPINPLAAGGLAMMQDAQSRFGDPPPQSGLEKPRKMNPAEETTLASNTTPLPATPISTPASQASLPSGVDSLRRFVDSNQFSVNWAQQQLLVIVPEYLPNFPQWKIPGGVQAEKLIYDIATGPGYVESKWGALSVILGDSRDNVEFAAGVLCFLAMADAINVVGRVRSEMDSIA